jgi:hypothetical protein
MNGPFDKRFNCAGPIVAHAHLGGLHHHYERRAA